MKTACKASDTEIMGLKLRLNAFHQVRHQEVYEAFAHFYQKRGQDLIDNGDEYFQFDLHEQDNGWTVLSLDGGWEWVVRREAARSVSRELSCTGFLFFVYDGDYWGYEMFRNGAAVDYFVSGEGDRPQEELGKFWFPGQLCTGNPRLIAEAFPWLRPSDVEPYLVPAPPYEDHEAGDSASLLDVVKRRAALNLPPRPGDEFRLWDECAILNFLCLLEVGVELRDHTVRFLGRVFRSFWIEGQNTHQTSSKKYSR